MSERVFTNARLVLDDGVRPGAVVVRDGVIAEVGEPSRAGEDMGGDLVMPGLVELHTDHLEGHYHPRPGVRWNETAAIQAHDAQMAASGVTTVFDCLRLGTDEGLGFEDFEEGEMLSLAGALTRAQNEGRLRAEHFFHLRCEVSAENCAREFDRMADLPGVRLASLMDHAPGQRQFQTMDQYILYYQTKKGLSDEEFRRFCLVRQAASEAHSDPNRRHIAQAAAARGIAVASHDDATLAHVADARRDGVAIAEFPTTVEAARASHEAGMAVLMGAPNVVRGGSHSGNIAAADLAREGLLDVLSSDYVPISLVHAPFVLAERLGTPLHEALATVTSRPARAAGLADRGRLAPGLRADLVRVRRGGCADVPVVRGVWREGARVA